MQPESSNLQPVTPPPSSSLGNTVRVSLLGSRSVVAFGVIGLLLAIGAIVVVLYFTRNSNATQPADKVTQQAISLEALAKNGQVSIDAGGSLSINGQLKVNDSLILAPQAQPAKPVTGQLYIDKDSGKLLYYDGSKFVSSAGTSSVTSLGGQTGDVKVGSGLVLDSQTNTIANAGVVSLQGQAGNVNLNSGPGITITGTTIGNSGVISVGGIAGDITLGAGLSVANGKLTNGGITSLGGANGSLSLGAGLAVAGTSLVNTGVTSLSSGSSNLVITDGGNGALTIQDTNVGGGGNVAIGPASVQNDPGLSNNPTIWLNEQGTGNLLQLSTGTLPATTNRFVVDNTGKIITGTIGYNQITNAPNFVSSFGGDIGAINVGSGLTYTSGTKTISNGGITSVTNGSITSTGQITIGSGLVLTGTTITATGSGVGSIAGTANQVIASSATGNVTLSLPQDIATTSTPSFTAIKLGSGSNLTTLSTSNTSPRTVAIPNASGTLAVSASGNIALDSFGNISLTGTIPVSSGGTGVSTSPTNGQLLIGNSGTNGFSLSTLTAGAGITITNAGGTITLTAPGSGSCSSCAQTDLSNLATTTSINTTLQPSVTNAVDLGSSVKRFANLYLGSGASVSGNLTVGGQVTLSNLTTNGVVTISGGTLASAATIGITNGGTGATTAGAALSALGGAARGVNTDITSLTGLTTITPSAALTVGASTKTLTLQGDSGTVISANSGANSTKLTFTAPTSTNTVVFPDAGGTVCLSTSTNCGTITGPGGANPALDNLSGVAINTSLLPGTAGTIDLGSTAKPFASLYLSGTSGTPGTNNFKFTGSASAPRTITLPDASGTVCLSTSTNCGSVTVTGFAATDLSNLTSTAINQSLLPNATNAIDLGSSALRFKNLYVAGTTDLSGGLNVGGATKLSSLNAAGVVLNAADGTLSSSNGALAVANGGTGTSSTPANGQLLIGNGSNYTLATLTQGSGVTITNGAGTVTISAPGSGTCSGCAQTDLSNLATTTKVNATLQPAAGSGNTYDLGALGNTFRSLYLGSNASIGGSLTVTGTTKLSALNSAGVVLNAADGTLSSSNGALAVANGGTGTGTSPTNGQLLIGNGSNYTLATLTQGSGVTITNAAGSITIASTGAGTCATCANQALSNLSGVALNASLQPTVANTNTLDLGASGATFRNLYLGTDASIAGKLTVGGTVKFTGLGGVAGVLLNATDGTVTSSSGALGIANGGTGVSSTPTDGQLLIGNSLTSGYTKATLTQGAGVTITNANGSITIASTGAGTCATCANQALSNLSGVALNATLQPTVANTNTLDLGASGATFRNLYLGTNAYIGGALNVTGSVTLSSLATNGVVTVSSNVLSSSASLSVTKGGTGITSAPANAQVLVGNATSGYDLRTLTDSSTVTVDTSTAGVLKFNSSCPSCVPLTGGTGYIQNQNASQQSSATFWIQNAGRSDQSFQSPIFDSAVAGVLKVGNSNATSVEIAKTGVTTTVKGPLSVATGQALTIGGSTTATVATATPSALGDIDTAANTVDKATYIQVNPSVNNLTLTLPTPAAGAAAAGRIIFVSNSSGSNTFTMYGVISGPGTTQSFLWSGTAWTVDGSGTTGNYIANQSDVTNPQTLANLAIGGSARVDTTLYTPSIDTYSPQPLNIGGIIATNDVLTAGTATQINLAGKTEIGGDLQFLKNVDHLIKVNTSTGTNIIGGALTLNAGQGSGTAAGGALKLQGGSSGTGATGNGGDVTIFGGNAASTLGNGGNITISGGAKTSTGNGGAVIIKPQASNDTTTAFQVQNAAGTAIFTADTSNKRLVVGSIGTTTGQLFISGVVPTATVGATSAFTSSANAVDVVGRYAYVVESSATNKLHIYDVSTPASPVAVNGAGATTSAQPYDIQVLGRYAYVVDGSGNKLEIFDISNASTTATAVGSITTASNPTALFVSGKYAYVLATTAAVLQVYDISNPFAPVQVGSNLAMPNTPNGIYVAGRYAYITQNTGSSFTIVDISNPASASIVSSPTTNAGPNGIYVQGRYAYVAINNSNSSQIFDISNPASVPAAVGTITTATNAVGITVQGRYAYVTEKSKDLEIFDISSPASPTSLGSVGAGITNNSGGQRSIKVIGRYAYIATNTAKNLNIYDLGGDYSQSIEAGSLESGALNVNGDTSLNNNVNVLGSIQAGQNLAVSNDLGVGGSAVFQNKVNSTKAFQVQNASSQAILNVDTSNGQVGIASLTTPTSFTVTPAAGGLYAANTTYYFKLTALDSSGTGETLPTTEVSATTTTTNKSFTLSWNAVPGATGYRLYKGTSAGGENVYTLYATVGGTSSSASGTSATPPTVNTSYINRITSSSIVLSTTANSTSSFQVQNTSGGSVLVVDSTNNRIGINTNGTTSTDLSFGTISGSTTARTIGVETQSTANVGGNGLTLTAGTGNGTGGGGLLTLQGGAGGASGGDGGSVAIVGANATAGGTNAGGNVTINAGNGYTTGANGTVTITGGGNGASSVAGGAVTIKGGSTNVAAGAVTVAGGSTAGVNSPGGDITLQGGDTTFSANGGKATLRGGNTDGGQGGILTLNAGFGSGAGASSGTGGAVTLQGGNGGAGTANTGGALSLFGGNSTGTGAGGNVVISAGAKSSGTAGSVIIKPQASSDSTTALLVQNANGDNLIKVDTATTATNLVTNGNFENTTTGWATKGSGVTLTPASTTSAFSGSYVASVTTGSAGSGISYTYTPSASTIYTMAFYMRSTVSNFSTLVIGRQDVSGTDVDCSNTIALTTSIQWTRYTCTFTTGSTITAPSTIYIKDTGTAHNFWVDGVTLTQSSYAPGFNPYGQVGVNAAIGSPLLVQNTLDSSTAFQIQNASGFSLLAADTINSRLNVGTQGTATGQLYIGGTTAKLVGGATVTLGFTTYGVTVVGKTLYCIDATNNRFKIYNVSVPNSPVLISSTAINVISTLRFIGIAGSKAIVTNQTGSFAIVDVSNPSSPSVGPTQTFSGTISQSSAVNPITISGKYAIIGAEQYLNVIDTSLSSSSFVGSYNNGSGGFSQTALNGRYLYAPSGNNSVMYVFDFINPSQLSSAVVGTYSQSFTGSSVSVSGKYAYITGAGTIEVVDISNPTAPSHVTDVFISGALYGASFVQGRYLYVADQGTFQTFDISNPALPVAILPNPTSISQSRGLTIQGRYAYMGYSGGYAVYDLGGTYSQTLEAGTLQTTSLRVDDSVVSGGSISALGDITAGRSLVANGDITGNGGLNVTAATPSYTNANGSSIILQAASGTGIGNGGNVVITAGGIPTTGSVTGSVTITGGASQSSSIAGGSVTITGGTGASVGGAVTISSGAGSGTNAGGTLTVGASTGGVTNIQGSSGDLNRAAGSLNILGGNGGTLAGSLTGGNVYISGGAKSTGASGSVVIRPQASNDAVNAFQIQTSTSSSSNILFNADTSNSRLGFIVTPAPILSSVLTSSGGSLTSGVTYYMKLTAVDSSGGESAPSTEFSATPSGANLTIGITLNSTSPGSTFRLYYGGSSGGESQYQTFTGFSFALTNGGIGAVGTPPSIGNAYATRISNAGLTVSTNSNSTSALSVQTYTGVNLLNVDTSNYMVNVGAGTYSNGFLNVGLKSTVSQVSNLGVANSTASLHITQIVGRYLYQLTTTSLNIYDITSPSSPVIMSSTTVSSPVALTVSGKYAYVTSNNGTTSKFQIYDVSNPASVTALGTSSLLSSTQRAAVAVYGKVLLASQFSTNGTNLYDVSNPSSPAALGSKTPSTYEYVQYGNMYYSVDYTGQKLTAIDMTNPTSPTINSLSTGQNFSVIGASNRYVYASTGTSTFSIYDVSKPSAMTSVGSVSTPGGVFAINTFGRYLYVALSNSTLVYDISTGASPTLVTTVGAGCTYGAAFSGRYLYCATGSDLYIYDMGGANISGLDTGSIQAGSIRVDADGSVGGNLSVVGNLTTAGVTTNGALTVNANQAGGYAATITNSSSATSAGAPGSSSDGLLIALGTANASRTTGNYFVAFGDTTGTVAGKIQGGASAVAYTTSGADYAEYFKAPQSDMPAAGELVNLDTSTTQGVVRATGANGAPLAGVVSTSPGFIGNGPVCQTSDANCDADYQKYNAIVALSGQVPTKVNTTNGPIAVGDPITSSSVAGEGAKATGTSYIVGYAEDSLASGSGTINVLIRPQYYTRTDASALQATDLSLSGNATVNGALTVNGNTKLTSLTANLVDASSLNISGGTTLNILTVTSAAKIQTLEVLGSLAVANAIVKDTLTVNGHIITGGDTPQVASGADAGTGAAVTIEGNDTSGYVTIKAGTAAAAGEIAKLTFGKPFGAVPHVVLTPANHDSFKLGGYFDKPSITTTGFTILSDGVPADGKTYVFSYFVVQ